MSLTDAAIWFEPFGEEDVELANLSNDYGVSIIHLLLGYHYKSRAQEDI